MMLVLSRKVNERIIIGDNIELMVVAIRGNKVRLGITAPMDVKILRTEIADTSRKEQQEQNSVG